MFLRRLKLQHIRSIPELELSFDGSSAGARQWTYFLGENGAGKSTVLRSLALILAGSDAIHELIGELDDWIRIGESDASIEVDFATQEGDLRTASLHFRRGLRLIDFLGDNQTSLKQVDAAIRRSDRNYFVVGYGVSRRSSNDSARRSVSEFSTFRSPRARAVATLFSGDAVLVSLEQWAMDLDYRRGQSGLEAVRTALDRLLPEVRFVGVDKDSRSLMFETPDGQLPLAALSDGYQAMAAWCGDLLWQITETFEDYRNPLQARGVLLIDELDLHLHPKWQRYLVSFLKDTLPNFQVIATTHSPLTIHQAGEGELYVLRRENQITRVQRYDGAPNRLMLHQLLQSPLFGLTTLDSPQVQSTRDELRHLQGIGAENEPSHEDRERIRELERQLDDVPDWREVPPSLRRTNDVLEKIAAQLADKPKDPEALRRMVDRAGGRSEAT